MLGKKALDDEQMEEKAAVYRQESPDFAAWSQGAGVIRHHLRTQIRIHEKMRFLQAEGRLSSFAEAYKMLRAADRLTLAGMWLVVHATYAQQVYLDGRPLSSQDCKLHPEGHTGGALNMVPAYVGYLLANALSGVTRSWLMGQGHCVAAIDAVNVLVDNMVPLHKERYNISDEGLTRFVQDFYAYSITPKGDPGSILGSHVHVNTAGGIMEGGYLGFAELQYVHMPLPGESLVAFLSDGAFEEQRGSDWASKWWRKEDTGLVAPILIANGRRIDQRSLLAQEGEVDWLPSHLRLCGFDPFTIDGRDPAAFAWAILEMEERLQAFGQAAKLGKAAYPVPIPYAIAETEKGYGFYGAGTNAAHNLPLGEVPAVDAQALVRLRDGLAKLWVSKNEIQDAVAVLGNHVQKRRLKEKDHPCATRNVDFPSKPPMLWKSVSKETHDSPMAGIDQYFSDLVKINDGLRVRLGNPDELRSNGMNRTLDLLKHRVSQPEDGVAESVYGRVITALNEEAVVCAALGNKAGLNAVVTYEAFAPKMLGALRQEIIFARQQKKAGVGPGWLSVPLILTSHTWENGKNEQSHQDPTCCEALMGEMADVSRVLFPIDWNTAVASMDGVYQSKGEIWTMVVPKRACPQACTQDQAQQLLQEGVVRLYGTGEEKEDILLVAVGAYQYTQARLASIRLQEKGIAHSVLCLLEPGRFRQPRDEQESGRMVEHSKQMQYFPATAVTRIFFAHMRPHVLSGMLRSLDTGMKHTHTLGYLNRGGTLDTWGLLFANHCTWAHGLRKIAESKGWDMGVLLSESEQKALLGEGDPSVLFCQT